MAQRIPSHSTRESTRSDLVAESSSEPEKRPREKYENETARISEKPRMRSKESDSDDAIGSGNRSFEKKPNLGMKIKNKWKKIKEKFSAESSTTSRTKKSTNASLYTMPSDLSRSEKIRLWRDNGQRLLNNKEALQHDFADSANEVTRLLNEGNDENAAQQFDETAYTGLGFRFFVDSTVDGLKILGSKSMARVTSTKTQDFLADDDQDYAPARYILAKPIKIGAFGIGPERFVDEVLKLLREIPEGCPVILDATHNELGPDELNQLVDVMENHPVIYHLDLSGNPLCSGDDACYAVARLFEALGPVSHLYLDETGINDQTALLIEESLSQNCCLRHLNLQNNNLTETGINTMIYAAVPSDFFGRKKDDSALTTIQLQHNAPDDWDPIITAINHVFMRANIFEEDFIPTSTAIPVQIDIPTSLIQELSVGETYVSEIISPQDNSVDDRL